MKRGIFAVVITCVFHIAIDMCSTNLLVTGRGYGEIPALVTRGAFTSTRVKGIFTDPHPGSSGLSPPMANGRLSPPRCTSLATQQRLRAQHTLRITNGYDLTKMQECVSTHGEDLQQECVLTHGMDFLQGCVRTHGNDLTKMQDVKTPSCLPYSPRDRLRSLSTTSSLSSSSGAS